MLLYFLKVSIAKVLSILMCKDGIFDLQVSPHKLS